MAVLYLLAYALLFSVTFGLGDAGIGLAVPSFPLMYVFEFAYSALSTFGHWWGDDFNLLLAFSVPNVVLWGLLLAWVFRVMRQRRAD